jgi:hypothetical protein
MKLLKDNSVFKTLRHIETVRNYLNLIIREILFRQENHDQSKLQTPEMEVFDKFTPLLRKVTYNSKEYKDCMEKMDIAINHHNATNKHHPEHYANGIKDMTLVDLIEMLCDWKSSSMRHNNGNILKSIEINQIRFNYSDELKQILQNTANWLDSQKVNHCAGES